MFCYIRKELSDLFTPCDLIKSALLVKKIKNYLSVIHLSVIHLSVCLSVCGANKSAAREAQILLKCKR